MTPAQRKKTGPDPCPERTAEQRDVSESGRRPALIAPPGACDCHIHVFGPRERFPLAADVAYTPDEAPLESYLALRRRLGIERTVVVQPSIYGTDNACTLEAIAEIGSTARGIAVLDPAVSDQELEGLHKAGIRGLRFSLVVKNALRPEHLESMASRIRPLGWHIQFRSTHRDLPELGSRLRNLPVDLCLDHLGSIPPDLPLGHPAWRVLLGLLDHGHCWVKLSAPYQLSKMPGPGFADYSAQVTAMAKIAPHRLLWGTNWPHPLVEDKPDDADLLDSLAEWIPDETIRRSVLVDNPAALYDFPRVIPGQAKR